MTVDGALAGPSDTTTYRFDADRELVGAISPDPDGAGAMSRRAVKTTYNADGRTTLIENGTVGGITDADWAAFTSLQQEATTYDAAGRKTSFAVTAAGTTFQVKQFTYDAAGRLQCSALRMNSATWGSLPLSACTPAATGSAGPDRIIKNTYDVVGRTIAVQSAFGTADQANEMSGTFSDNGKLSTVTDANTNTTTYEYDGFDRVGKIRYPGSLVGSGTSSSTDYEQFVYDAGGNVTSRRLRGYAGDSSRHIDYSYDALNRLVLKVLPGSEPSVAFSYDNLGRLISAYTASNYVTLGYDALGRTTTQTTPFGTLTAGYDLVGRRISTAWPDAFYVTYDRLVTGEVTAVRENGAASGPGLLATYSYDSLGRRTGVVRGNGTTTAYVFDAISRATSLSHDIAGTSSDVTLGFSYNPAGQITTTTRSNDSYAWQGNVDTNLAYTANGLNEVTNVGGGAVTYDAQGNLASTGANTYSYSSENLLLSGPSATATYDPMMRLYQTTGAGTQLYAYDGAQRIAEYSAGGAILRRYVVGGAGEPLVWYEGSGTSDRRWLHADERGSIIAVTNSLGATIATNSYDEYGVPAIGNVGAFQFSGQAWLPDIGLYYYKARMYSSKLGRFMQSDPIGYGSGMNRYNYVAGDPVNFVDASGLNCVGISFSDENGNDIGETYWSPDCANTDDSSGGGSSGTDDSSGGGSSGGGGDGSDPNYPTITVDAGGSVGDDFGAFSESMYGFGGLGFTGSPGGGGGPSDKASQGEGGFSTAATLTNLIALDGANVLGVSSAVVAKLPDVGKSLEPMSKALGIAGLVVSATANVVEAYNQCESGGSCAAAAYKAVIKTGEAGLVLGLGIAFAPEAGTALVVYTIGAAAVNYTADHFGAYDWLPDHLGLGQ
ncbi:RHS repeat-associated core domain-containing protein [Sphingomonas oligophenolica]|uniref:RHS repeat-associated core domain-containing protein n=1 Tax=Sphingomonas oligophenolica TaxID=301154 RepID=A0ABU9YC94_9SPHN